MVLHFNLFVLIPMVKRASYNAFVRSKVLCSVTLLLKFLVDMVAVDGSYVMNLDQHSTGDQKISTHMTVQLNCSISQTPE